MYINNLSHSLKNIIQFFYHRFIPLYPFQWKECWSMTCWTREKLFLNISSAKQLKTWLSNNHWLETSMFLYKRGRICIFSLKEEGMLWYPPFLSHPLRQLCSLDILLCSECSRFICLLYHAAFAEYTQESQNQLPTLVIRQGNLIEAGKFSHIPLYGWKT